MVYECLHSPCQHFKSHTYNLWAEIVSWIHRFMRTSRVSTPDITDEAYFYRCSRVKYNYLMWGLENPTLNVVPKDENSILKLSVWCGWCITVSFVSLFTRQQWWEMHFTVRQIVQGLLVCCNGTYITEWSACFFFSHFLVTKLEREGLLPGHIGHQTSCHRTSFLWGFVKNIMCDEMEQNVQGVEMHYKCSYTEYCWTCWIALGRRLNGVLMSAKQRNMNTWSCTEYGCELRKICHHSNHL